MGKNLTTIRGRILELVRKQGFEVSKFFDEIGESYESFKGNKLTISPKADVLVKIRTKIPDANIDWILTGEGEMLSSTAQNSGINKEILEKFYALFESSDIIKQNSEVMRQNGELIKIVAKFIEK